MTGSEDVKAALQKAVDAFGRLDVALNNAGVENEVKEAADVTEAEWDRSIAINLTGVFLCMKHEIPLMLKQGGGAIVNTSEVASAHAALPPRGLDERRASGKDGASLSHGGRRSGVGGSLGRTCAQAGSESDSLV